MEKILQKYKDFLLARNLSLNYYNIIKIWLIYLSLKKIDYLKISQETITQFFIENSSYSDNSKCQFIKANRHFYSQFLQISKEQNEWYKIKMPKVTRKIPDFLSEEEIEYCKKQIIINFSNKFPPTKTNALIDFMFDSGIRKNELLILKREDFNFKDNSTKVFGKGKKERYILYTEKTKREIEKYFQSEKEINNAFNLTKDKLDYLMRKLKQYTGKRIYAHLFRHSAGRDIISKGGDISTVKELLGHSSITTTQIYTIPNFNRLKKDYKKIKG